MYFDSHVHSELSTDSRSKLGDLQFEANEKQMGLVITDHQDLIFRRGEAFTHFPEEFFQAYLPKRSESLLLGVEVGLKNVSKAEILKDIASYPYDFILGSVHAPYNDPIAAGLENDEHYRGMNEYEAQKHYLRQVIEAVADSPHIDALAHLDYALRYSPKTGPYFHLDGLREVFEDLFRLLVANQTVLELNTRRLDDPRAFREWKGLLRLYQQFGGEAVTIGSDAHRAGDVGRNFRYATELLGQVGLRSCHFKNRVRQDD